jgi:2-polyprenyl-3-methyl-5-hydroxy-6-metoxy-1,4-benzoquinol methylase
MLCLMRLREYILGSPRMYTLWQWIISRKGLNEKIITNFLQPYEGMRVLDVGSGVSNILTILPKCTYVGIDHNEEYVQLANSKYGDVATFYCADVSDIKQLVQHKFDRILLLRIMHHLSDNEVIELLRECSQLLNHNGLILTMDCAFTADQHWIAKFLAAQDRGHFVRRPEQYAQLVCEELKIVKMNVVEGLLRVPYTHVIFQFTNES